MSYLCFMSIGKRILVILLMGVFSTHTFADFHSTENQIHRSVDSGKVLLQKSAAITSTPYYENNGKRVVIENSGFQNWISFNAPSLDQIQNPVFDRTVRANFNLKKDFFLSSVHLIFPFQYFW